MAKNCVTEYKKWRSLWYGAEMKGVQLRGTAGELAVALKSSSRVRITLVCVV